MDKYAKYAITDHLRIRLEPKVVKQKVAVFYKNNALMDDPRTAKFVASLPKTIKPLPKVKNVNIAVVGKVIRNAKGGLTFLAENILLEKNKEPFAELTAQQLLWERKFYTPLFLQKFLTFKGVVPVFEAKKQILEVKEFLLARFKGKIMLKGLKKT